MEHYITSNRIEINTIIFNPCFFQDFDELESISKIGSLWPVVHIILTEILFKQDNQCFHSTRPILNVSASPLVLVQIQEPPPPFPTERVENLRKEPERLKSVRDQRDPTTTNPFSLPTQVFQPSTPLPHTKNDPQPDNSQARKDSHNPSKKDEKRCRGSIKLSDLIIPSI